MVLEGLFNWVLGTKSVEDEAVKRTGVAANVISAVYDGVEKATGKQVDRATEERLKEIATKATELSISMTPLGPINEATKILDDVDDITKEGAEEAADMLISAITGRTAELQMEALIGTKIDDSMPFTSALTTQMAVVTDISLVASTASIIAEVASLGQIDQIGREARSYLDYSGLSQVTGFGYGMILSSALQQGVQQEINQKIPLSLMDPTMLTLARFREIIDDETYFEEMGKHGYSIQNAERILNTSQFYPSGTDFITFAVRDVFNPEVVQSGGLDEAFPQDIVEFAEKAGMPEDILRWYWRAHWQLPSPQMGFEMLQRRLIDEDELRSLLRAADWAPGWIDNIMAISYNPITRVDARRMWETGVLDDEGYKNAMMDLGYNEESAQLYVDWAKANATSAEKDLTQTTVIKAYNTGLMTRETAKGYIQRFGYDADEAELIVTLEDQKVAEEILGNEIGLLQWQYSRAEIVEDTFLRKMEELGIPRAEATRYLSKAEADKVKRAKLPPIESIKRWYQGELITQAEAKDYLTRSGYRAKERDLFIEEWKV
ncbi:MAG: hypothetical protein PHI12_12290 [Dehalococcoidales bacterium]|nr:hypothetical protein [Dehalococcoidales bacterium]